MMDEYCVDGVIGGAVFDNGNKPKNAAKGKLSFIFGDNSSIIYDRESSILSIDIKGDVEVKGETVKVTSPSVEMTCTTEVKITAPMTTITGALAVSGVVAVGGLTGASGAPVPGNIEVAGEIKGATVKAGLIGLGTHKHTSTSGGGVTTAPIP